MKVLKIKFILLALTLAVIPFLSSCNDDDGYSLNSFTIRMATVKVISGNSYYLQIDNGKTLWPAATLHPGYRPKDGQRVIADFTLLSSNFGEYDYAIRVNRLRNILTKPTETLTSENENIFGNNPVSVYDMWVGGNHLNVQFRFSLPSSQAHRISLVENTTSGSPSIDSEGYKLLEYRYNNQNDTTNLWSWGYVSFDLGENGPWASNNLKGIKVKINSRINGERTLVFNYAGRDSTEKTFGQFPDSLSEANLN
ncbi:MAG: NigD-like protein [Dysgonamonadaceae bacterium]